MIWILFALFSFLPTQTSNTDGPVEKRLTLLPTSQIEVHGKSNVNRFSCSIEEFKHSDTLYVRWEGDSILHFRESTIHVPVNNFDCSNKMIRRDFLEMVKSEEYPYLTMELQWMNWNRKAWSVGKTLKGEVIVTLANVSRTYPQDFKLYLYRNTVTLSGIKKLSMHDFNLEVPSKVMGLIKVKPEVEVHFDLRLQMPKTGFLPY